MHKVHLRWSLRCFRRQVCRFAPVGLEIQLSSLSFHRGQRCPSYPHALRQVPRWWQWLPSYKVNLGLPPPHKDLAVPLGDVEGFRFSESKVIASSADRTGVPPSRAYQQIQDICTNCSHPPGLEIFQNEKEIHLPTIPRACLFSLQYMSQSLFRYSAHTLSLKSSQPDVTQPVLLSAIRLYHRGHKN